MSVCVSVVGVWGMYMYNVHVYVFLVCKYCKVTNAIFLILHATCTKRGGSD